MKRFTATLVLLGLALAAFPLFAQDAGARPAPKVLQIVIEDVKPGHSAAHESTEMGWPKAFRASKASISYLAMTSLTGPNEAWYLTGYDSLQSWEKQRNAEQADAVLSAEFDRLSAADSEHISGLRNVVVRFREDLSHRPALNLGTYRYVNVVTVRVRAGQADKFAAARKMVKAAHEKAGMTDYYSIFEVVSGMRAPSFLIMIPMKSLAEGDAAPALHNSAAYKEALGGDLGEQKMSELTGAAVIDNESAIFAFSPKMSLPAAEVVAADPMFWNAKPVVAPTSGKTKTTAAKID